MRHSDNIPMPTEREKEASVSAILDNGLRQPATLRQFLIDFPPSVLLCWRDRSDDGKALYHLG